MCNRDICSIDEELPETGGGDQGPIIVLNELAAARNLPRAENQPAQDMTDSENGSVHLKGNVGRSG